MLWHKTIGSGEDLVLLHGWGFNARVFQNIDFGKWRIILIDLPGHGKSAHIDGTLDDWSEAVASCMPMNATVAGWSLGGLVALNIARTVKCKELILLASTPCFVNSKQWQYGIEASVFKSFYEALTRDLDGTLKQFALLQTQDKQQARVIYQQISQHPAQPKALKAGLDILLNNDLSNTLTELHCPVRAVLGRYDRLVPIAIQMWYQRQNIQCTLYNTGHIPFLDKMFCLSAMSSI